MSEELKEVTSKIDKEFINYFKNDSSVKTIFVTGSMARTDYVERVDNDYNIRVVSDNITASQLLNFELFLNNVCKKLSTSKLEVSYSCLEKPVGHKVSLKKKNVLIHSMIHRQDQMNEFVPVTNKVQSDSSYRIVFGEDSLKKLQNVKYELNDLLEGKEGLRYYINMLKKIEYRYLTWDINGDNCFINFYADKIISETILENCFYYHNKFIDNMMNYCKKSGYDISNNKFSFAMTLFGIDEVPVELLLLINGLLNKDVKFIRMFSSNPLLDTIKILEKYLKRVNELDLIFYKKDNSKGLAKI